MSNFKASLFSAGFRAVVSAALLPFLYASALAEESIDPNVTQYTLANGLTVILAPSKTAQSVAVVTQYNVGSANEAPGRSGFAHLFEHLMFEGTKAVPDFDKVVSGAGGDNNAFTQEDTTTYHMSGPKEALGLFLRLDADRMANLANAVSQEDLDNQRAIVLNEMRQNVLDQPGGAAHEQASAALYPAGHPYAHSTIGSIADLGAAKLEDVVAFHRVNYVPSNASVAVTGSFDIEKTKALIDQTFGLIPKSEKPKTIPPVPVAAKAQRLNFVDAVATPVVVMQWPGAAGYSKQTVTNDMLAVAMTVGATSLDNRLVVRQGVASGVSVNFEDRQLGGVFTIMASGAQGISAGKLEEALRKALDEMRAEGISEEALKIARTDIETGYASVPSLPVGFGINLVSSALNGDARAWRSEVEIAKTVTAAEVNAAFGAFANETAQTWVVTPGPRNTNYPPAIANPTGTSQAVTTVARSEVVIPEIAMADAASVVFPASETRKLASGASLIVYRIDDPAKVGIAVTAKGGDVDAATGLSGLAMAVSSRGAGELSLADMDARFRKSGISMYGFSGKRQSQIIASAPITQFSALATQLADVILRPQFEAKEWTAAVDQTVNGLESARKSPDYLASRKLIAALYPAGSPEAREPDIERLKALTSDDAKALFLARMRPDEAVFHVATGLSADEVAAALDKAFAGWSDGAKPGPAQPYARPTVTEIRLESQVDGATQAAVVAAMAAPNGGTREAAAFSLAVQTLGGDADSRLNTILREEKGWSYGIGADVSGEKGRDNSLLIISSSVQTDHAEASIAEIRRIIAALASEPISEEEFQAARRTTRAAFLRAFDSAPAMAGLAVSLSSSGYSLEELKDYLGVIETITLEEVNKQAAIIAKSAIALSVAGDKAVMK